MPFAEARGASSSGTRHPDWPRARRDAAQSPRALPDGRERRGACTCGTHTGAAPTAAALRAASRAPAPRAIAPRRKRRRPERVRCAGWRRRVAGTGRAAGSRVPTLRRLRSGRTRRAPRRRRSSGPPLLRAARATTRTRAPARSRTARRGARDRARRFARWTFRKARAAPRSGAARPYRVSSPRGAETWPAFSVDRDSGGRAVRVASYDLHARACGSQAGSTVVYVPSSGQI